MKFMGLISTSDAAERLGVHITRVQVLIREGRLPAQRIGRTYVVDENDLKLVEERKTGRPPKQTPLPEKRATSQKKLTGRTSTKGKGKGK